MTTTNFPKKGGWVVVSHLSTYLVPKISSSGTENFDDSFDPDAFLLKIQDDTGLKSLPYWVDNFQERFSTPTQSKTQKPKQQTPKKKKNCRSRRQTSDGRVLNPYGEEISSTLTQNRRREKRKSKRNFKEDWNCVDCQNLKETTKPDYFIWTSDCTEACSLPGCDYLCSCHCYQCRPRTQLRRHHLVCFTCRKGWKDYWPREIRQKPNRDEKDRRCLPFSEDNERSSDYRINQFDEKRSCPSCQGPLFVGGNGLRFPRQDRVKEWKILEQVLTRLPQNARERYMNSCVFRIPELPPFPARESEIADYLAAVEVAHRSWWEKKDQKDRKHSIKH